MCLLGVRAHQELKQHRHHGKGQRETGQQRHAYRQRQGREQIFGGSLQQENRHEDDADAQCRQNRRNRHLARAVDDGLS
jgi:hypothetical protein